MSIETPPPGTALDRIYGCLIAGAIGDALGAPVEGWSYHRIREEYGRVEEFMPYSCGYSTGKPGVVTDDTTLRHYICYAIVQRGGRITPDELGEIWHEHLNPDRLWDNETLVSKKIAVGMNPWETGQGTIPSGVASMAIEPIGIVNAGDPRQAYQDAFTIASINQEGVNRDAAAAFAAGIAHAFSRDATVESVVRTIREQSSSVFGRAIDLTMDVAYDSSDVDEFAERFYDELLDWSWPIRGWDLETYYAGEFFSGHSHEFVPAALAITYLCDGAVEPSIIEGASFGRDCDTISKLCGNITGALHGTGPIRDEWIEVVEEANGPFFEELEGDPDANFFSMAERIVEALANEADRAGEREDELRALFG